MNGAIDADVLNYLVDGKFKRIGKTPSLVEWQQERDQLEWDLRMNAWSRIMGKQEAAYWAEPQCMSMSDLSTLFASESPASRAGGRGIAGSHFTRRIY